MINISPRQLQVFVQIALHGSVRAAAERLYLTQPAASMALAEMERQLDAPVFARERGTTSPECARSRTAAAGAGAAGAARRIRPSRR
jgi:DNA-binding transcriptional LysR family regulator